MFFGGVANGRVLLCDRNMANLFKIAQKRRCCWICFRECRFPSAVWLFAGQKKIPETGWLILFRGVAYTLNPRVVSTAVTVVRIRFIHTDHLFFVLSVMFSSFHDSILRSALCDACVAEQEFVYLNSCQ